jgi:hypothetical protein
MEVSIFTLMSVQNIDTTYINLQQLCPQCKGTMEKEYLRLQDLLNFELPSFFWANRSGTPLLHDKPLCIEGKPQIAYRCRQCDMILIRDHQSTEFID